MRINFPTATQLHVHWSADHKQERSEARALRFDLAPFALLTAKLKVAATVAADCQGKHSSSELRDGGVKLREMLDEFGSVVDGTVALLDTLLLVSN